MLNFIEDEQNNFFIEKQFKNQKIKISFCEMCKETEPILKWNVALIVYTKRKKIEQNFNNIESTGYCGLAPLLFAKQAIIDFEEFISKVYIGKKFICIRGSDKRRRKVYEYALKPLGYNYQMLQLYGDKASKKYLIKKLY
ncbi:MAG TPA: hypothetical protein VMZ91_15400 [Candidatus Paceibacterota bacterium]|nr:hypothetical protein [Candidatus Paceibacterota bacterium]